MSRKTIVICIFLLCVFILACEAQRGGGRSSGRSRSSSRFYSSSGSRKKCEYVDGVKKCKKVKEEGSLYFLLIPVFVLVLVGIYDYRCSKDIKSELPTRKIDDELIK